MQNRFGGSGAQKRRNRCDFLMRQSFCLGLHRARRQRHQNIDQWAIGKALPCGHMPLRVIVTPGAMLLVEGSALRD
jgi:hypothetical protein